MRTIDPALPRIGTDFMTPQVVIRTQNLKVEAKPRVVRRLFLFSIVLLMFLDLADVKPLMAQEPLDGRNRIFRDELLETFTWNPESKRWVFLMEQKDQTGKWKVFAEDSLRRP